MTVNAADIEQLEKRCAAGRYRLERDGSLNPGYFNELVLAELDAMIGDDCGRNRGAASTIHESRRRHASRDPLHQLGGRHVNAAWPCIWTGINAPPVRFVALQ